MPGDAALMATSANGLSFVMENQGQGSPGFT
jgi:hypothetical protein